MSLTGNRLAPFILIYGDTGTGKTVEEGRTIVPDRAIGIGPAGSFKSIETTLGIPLSEGQVFDHINTVPQLIEFIGELRESGLAESGIDGLWIDDLSIVMDQTYMAMKADHDRYPKNELGDFKGSAAFRFWDDLKSCLLRLRYALRASGLWVVASAHVAEPTTEENEKTKQLEKFRGGPRFQSKKMTALLPYVADSTIRIVKAKNALGTWKGAYWVDPHNADWYSKDRHNMCWDNSPQNLREMLRACEIGYVLPRQPGCEWQDEVVERVAGELLGLPSAVPTEQAKAWRKVLGTELDRLLAANYNECHIDWALQDAYACAVFRARKRARLNAWKT